MAESASRGNEGMLYWSARDSVLRCRMCAGQMPLALPDTLTAILRSQQGVNMRKAMLVLHILHVYIGATHVVIGVLPVVR
jgi:hypothetical protein